MQAKMVDVNGALGNARFGKSGDGRKSQPSSMHSSPASSRRSSPPGGNINNLQASTVPLPPSRRSSYSEEQNVTVASSADGSIATLTPSSRVSSFTALSSLASPSTYYRPVARFFPSNSRPSSSSGKSKQPPQFTSQSSSTPSTPMANSDDYDQRAHHLILGALERTRSEQLALRRTESIASSRSATSQRTQVPEQDSPTSSPQVTPSSSSILGKGWGSVLGLSRTKDKNKDDDKDDREQRGRSDSIRTDEPSPSATPSTTQSSRSSWLGVPSTSAPLSRSSSRPSTAPSSSSPRPFSAIGTSPLAALPTAIPPASDKRRGRSEVRERARSSSPFRLYRSRTKEKEGKEKKSSGRSPSPAISALRQSDVESDAETLGKRSESQERRRRRTGTKVRSSAFDMRVRDDTEDDDATEVDDEEEEDESWSDEDADEEDDDDDGFDPITEQNTEANATPLDLEACLNLDGIIAFEEDEIELPDPLGEGVNVIRPEEPLFARTLMGVTRHPSGSRKRAHGGGQLESLPEGVATQSEGAGPSSGDGDAGRTSSDGGNAISPQASSSIQRSNTAVSGKIKRRKTIKAHTDPLPLETSRPKFERNRCTVVLRHGDPHAANVTPEGKKKRTPKKYVVASDLSEESKWAVEWGIGTVLRDGDEMIIVTVQETETKLDPVEGGNVDRVNKLRNQQERQALSYLLVRQATGLLQRTKLSVTVTCQALHAKNSRRLLLDLIDYIEPTMVIVGSRGLGKLKGILLGSTSHYLIQKSSVPVMVARRRLKRPTKRSAATAAEAHQLHAAKRVSLAEAAIDKQSPGKGKGSVGVDAEELQKEDEEAEKNPKFDMPDEDEESDTEEEPVRMTSPTSPKSAVSFNSPLHAPEAALA